MRYFIKNIARKRIEKKMLLLLDNYELYRIFRFWSFAIEYKIILFKLLFYSTHLLQSLDVDVFQVYK